MLVLHACNGPALSLALALASHGCLKRAQPNVDGLPGIGFKLMAFGAEVS